MDKRVFVVHASKARGDGKFTLKDLPGSGGRMDIVARCINSSFFLSDDIRKNVVLYLILEGGRYPVLVMMKGSDIRNLNPDERTTGALIRHALLKTPGDDWKEVLPGISTKKGNFNVLFTELDLDDFSVLDVEGEPVEGGTEKRHFLLGDHKGFTDEIWSFLDEKGVKKLSLGPLEYHTDHCILHINMLMDK